MIAVNRQRLASLTNERLLAECTKLSIAWTRIGRPDPDDMPREMLVRYLALTAERERRGDQLSLF